MRKDESRKLEAMNSQEASRLLLFHIDDMNDIINHLNENGDISNLNTEVLISRLRGYMLVLEAEAILLASCLNKEKINPSKKEIE